MSEDCKEISDNWVPSTPKVPDCWETPNFVDLIDNISTNGIKTPQKSYLQEGSFPVIDQGQDLIGGYTNEGTKILRDLGQIIIFGDHTRCFKFINFDFAPGADGVKVLRPDKNINPKYIYYALKAIQLPNRGYSRHYSFLKKSKLPLPPLNEQKRIVAKIEELFSELDKGIESLKTAREQLKVYRQAVLKHAFEGKLTADWRKRKGVSADWEISSLGESGIWAGGGTPSKQESSYWENGEILWVSPKDMKFRTIKDTQQKITLVGVENSSAKIIEEESILFVVRSGILRRVLPVSMAVKGITVNQDLQTMIPAKHILPFVYWYCQCHEWSIRHECSKDGTTVESIDIKRLKEFRIPVPTDEEQQEIINRIESILSQIDETEKTIEEEMQKTESLRQSILKKAFSGKLVAQDPNDEPASVLLERIKAEKEKSKKKRSAA